MKSRLRIKQILKGIIINSLTIGFIWLFVVIPLDTGTQFFNFTDWVYDPASIKNVIIVLGVIALMTLIILPYILVNWLLEHTPLKTKELKERVHNIKDSKTINKTKQDILDKKEE